MITTKIIKIKYTNSLTEIEKVFAEQNISPLRWAIVKLDGETMFLNIVFNKT